MLITTITTTKILLTETGLSVYLNIRNNDSELCLLWTFKYLERLWHKRCQWDT